jgi:TraB/PrgY/gumN family
MHLFKILLLFFALSIVKSHASAQSNARLYLIEKGNHRGFVLAESHFPTKVELDAYFYDVVLRAADIAKLYADEGPPGLYFDPANLSDCANFDHMSARRSESNKVLNDALIASPGKLAVGSIATLGDKAKTESFVSGYPFFLKLIEVKMQIGDRINTSLIQNQVNSGPARLIHDRMVVKSKKQRAYVEAPSDFRAAFCMVRPERQHAVVKAFVAQMSKADVDKIDIDHMERCYLSSVQTVHRQLQCSIKDADCLQKAKYPSPQCVHPTNWDEGYYEFAISARNKAWMPHLTRLMSETVPFFSVGGAHLLDTTAGFGIFTMLRESGYTVTLINDRSHLNRLWNR